ncbi:MAG TPA: hypothetical protein IAC21_03150 [Candidatus Enterenecus merdae]|nr:hypothetical protein [Candidatus Enterenecus merdae]
MANQDLTHLSIRLHPNIHDKFKYVAEYEGRSMSKQILYLVNQCIRSFEREHGPIELPGQER